MNLTKNEQEIIELFRKDVFLKATMLHIQKLLKKNAYQRIFDAVKSLAKSKVLSTEKIGKSTLVSLAKTPECAILLAYIEEKNALSKEFSSTKKILELPELADDIIIITGSYAKGTEKKTSDLDLAIITKDDTLKKVKYIENATLSSFPPIHPTAFTPKDFLEMLLSKEHNFGKEVFKNHYILKNARRYYEIVFEAMKNGFNV